LKLVTIERSNIKDQNSRSTKIKPTVMENQQINQKKSIYDQQRENLEKNKKNKSKFPTLWSIKPTIDFGKLTQKVKEEVQKRQVNPFTAANRINQQEASKIQLAQETSKSQNKQSFNDYRRKNITKVHLQQRKSSAEINQNAKTKSFNPKIAATDFQKPDLIKDSGTTAQQVHRQQNKSVHDRQPENFATNRATKKESKLQQQDTQLKRLMQNAKDQAAKRLRLHQLAMKHQQEAVKQQTKTEVDANQERFKKPQAIAAEPTKSQNNKTVDTLRRDYQTKYQLDQNSDEPTIIEMFTPKEIQRELLIIDKKVKIIAAEDTI
jgi:hypothetical protein